MGVGTYNGHPGAYIPGSGRTVLLAGHANTVFNRLGELRPGDLIHIDTSYGRYRYRVTDTGITKDTDTTAYDFTRTYENLILYTCYPFDTFGLTNYRYFVYAEYLSGPKLDLLQ
jgi:sortase A